MDRPDRTSLRPGSLHDELFLRGNWRIVEHIRKRLADELRDVKMVGGKRKLEQAARVQAAGPGAAAAAKAAAATRDCQEAEGEAELSD
jgi:hypothetical protein